MSGAEHMPSAPRISYSFPRSARLLKHAAFDRAYRQGRRIFSADLTVFVRLREDCLEQRGPRVGFTVGRVLGNAVTRNRIKRRMREVVRLEIGGLSQPVDVVINPKKTALHTEFALLRRQIAKAFAQAQRQIAAEDCREGAATTPGQP